MSILSQNILELKNISKSYRSNSFGQAAQSQKDTLYNVSYNFIPGQMVGLVGHSGSGKSTLARIMAGMLTATEGEVIYQGHVIGKNHKPLSLQVICQNPDDSFPPQQTLLASLQEVNHVHKVVPKCDQEKYFSYFYDVLKLTQSMAHKFPYQLSGGQLQRFAIMRALMVKPNFLICDEILTNLDIESRIQILDMLKRLQQEQQLSGLFISHDIYLVHYICAHILEIKSGQLFEVK